MDVSKTMGEKEGSTGSTMSEDDFAPPAETAQRIARLRSKLDDVKISVENRKTLIKCAQRDPEYRIRLPRNRGWKANAMADNRVYYALCSQIDEVGFKATKTQLEKWEMTAEELRQNALHLADIAEEDSWVAGPTTEGVFTPEWSFETATKRPESHEELE